MANLRAAYQTIAVNAPPVNGNGDMLVALEAVRLDFRNLSPREREEFALIKAKFDLRSAELSPTLRSFPSNESWKNLFERQKRRSI